MRRDRDRLAGIAQLARDGLDLTTDNMIAVAMLSALTHAERATLADLIDTFPDVWADLEDQDGQPHGLDDGAAADRARDHAKDNQMEVL